jgi:hypothetical protein
MIYLLTAIGLSPGGSSTIHIYTHTMHRTTQITTNVEEWGPCPVFASYILTFSLQLREKTRKNLSQGKKNLRVQNTHTHTITKPTHNYIKNTGGMCDKGGGRKRFSHKFSVEAPQNGKDHLAIKMLLKRTLITHGVKSLTTEWNASGRGHRAGLVTTVMTQFRTEVNLFTGLVKTVMTQFRTEVNLFTG